MSSKDYMLTAEELRLKRQRRRRIISIVLTLVIVLVLAVVVARPTRDAIKGWQSRRHAEKAFLFIDRQDWSVARDEAVAGGITINGLAILKNEPFLDLYYAASVVGGRGAFVMTARDFDDFAEAILAKLIREVAMHAGGAIQSRGVANPLIITGEDRLSLR